MRAPLACALMLLVAGRAEALALAPRTLRRPAPAPRAPQTQMFGPGAGGGFLNLGTPEVIVIGAVAWVLLGPKELYRLAREAGSFLGEWQSLGRQAQKTFQDALDSEMADGTPDSNSPSSIASRLRQEANEFATKMQTAATSPPAPTSSPQGPPQPDRLSVSNAPPAKFSDLDSAYAKGEIDEDALMAELKSTLGDPETNRANFAQQISGERNRQVLAENPAPTPLDDPLQEAEEDLLSVQIQEAENALASLKAEQEVLALRRKQLEANAQRARRMAQEDVPGREGSQA